MGGVDHRRRRPRLFLNFVFAMSSLLLRSCGFCLVTFARALLVTLSPAVVYGQDQHAPAAGCSPLSVSPSRSLHSVLLTAVQNLDNLSFRSGVQSILFLQHSVSLTTKATSEAPLTQWLIDKVSIFSELQDEPFTVVVFFALGSDELIQFPWQTDRLYLKPEHHENIYTLLETNKVENSIMLSLWPCNIVSVCSSRPKSRLSPLHRTPTTPPRRLMLCSDHPEIYLHTPAKLTRSLNHHVDSSFDLKCSRALTPRSSIAHLVIIMTVVSFRSPTMILFRRLRGTHLVWILTKLNLSFRTSGYLGEYHQNPNDISLFELGPYGPYLFAGYCYWTRVLIVVLSGMSFIILSQHSLVYLIHGVIVTHVTTLTSLPNDHPSVRESPTLLPLILRAVNPERFLTVRRYTSLLESTRIFQAAQRRVIDLDSLRLPLIFDSLECLEHLSHRELCCIYPDIHNFSLLLEALSCLSIIYVSFASVSCFDDFFIVFELLCTT